jgi:hypothetical protein
MWSTQLPENWPTMIQQGSTLVGLNRRARSPYYWDRRNFYVFDSESALEIQVMGGDLVLWIHS